MFKRQGTIPAGHKYALRDIATHGNKKGGITTLEEKTLGCIEKVGSTEIVDVLAYGELVKVGACPR